MPVTLRTITEAECQQVRVWRNAPDVFPMLRTGYKTEAEQAAFYRDVICNPWAPHRYYAIDEDIVLDVTTFADPVGARVLKPFPVFIGIGGLTYLDRVPGEAEISLVLGPDFRGQGYGTAALDALLREAWRLGLSAVIGECYEKSPALGFWQRMLDQRPPVSRSWRWEKP